MVFPNHKVCHIFFFMVMALMSCGATTATHHPWSTGRFMATTTRPTRHVRQQQQQHQQQQETVQMVSIPPPTATTPPSLPPKLLSTLLRGAALRISSDLAGGTVFENIKTRVTTTDENMFTAAANIIARGGVPSLWSGSSTRIVEGAMVGAVFMLGSTLTKQRLRALGVPPTLTALGGGLVGGICQAMVMTPAGMVFTSLNVQRTTGQTSGNAVSATRNIIADRGWRGMYSGFVPMTIRQATNWASRAGFTEVARSNLGLQRYGIYGEIGSGIIGGVGSCWNTPIETVRVLTQRDISTGKPTKSITGYWQEIYARDGPTGLFRGVSPRALQAIWQTCFLVVVPNLMGI